MMYMSFFVYVPIEVLLCCTLVGACGPKAMNKILLSCYPVQVIFCHTVGEPMAVVAHVLH